VRGILTTIEFAFVCRGVCFEFLQHLISFAHQKTIEIFFIIQLYSSRGSKRILLKGEEGKTWVCTSNLYSAAVPEPKIEAKVPKIGIRIRFRISPIDVIVSSPCLSIRHTFDSVRFDFGFRY